MSIKRHLFPKNRLNNQKGFTFIELLVVISVISLISSVIFASLNVARAKARDGRKIAEVASVRNALNVYLLDKKKMPNMYTCTSSCVIDNNRLTLEIEDQTNPTNPTTESGKAYRATLNDLVTGGYIASIPATAAGAPYSYYNYGSGNNYGGMFGTNLEVSKIPAINSCLITPLDLTTIDCTMTNTAGAPYIANCYVNCRYYTNTAGSVTQVPGYPGQPLDGRGGAYGALCVQVRSLCDPANGSDFCTCAPF